VPEVRALERVEGIAMKRWRPVRFWVRLWLRMLRGRCIDPVICRLFGHDWRYVGLDWQCRKAVMCARCYEVREVEEE